MHKSTTKANFTEKIAAEYHFWEQQVLRFDLNNVESESVFEEIGKVIKNHQQKSRKIKREFGFV